MKPHEQMLAQRYQLQHLLGKKAGRQTWLATDLQTQQQVVIKLLLFGDDFEWDNLKLFEREAAVLKTLSHPAIPSYLDYFEVDLSSSKGFALVQTYIAAESLEQHLKHGRTFTEAEVKQIAEKLLEILIYLHDRHPPVIHRDIKPSNILLATSNSPGDVYLVDFGAVQIAAPAGGTMTVVGTYGYMSPEQFGGRAFPASDLYSLGTTLIYLSTGQHPADLQDGLQLEFQPYATSLSPALVYWLRRMTEPDRKRRFAAARDALLALNHLSNLAIAPVAQKPEGSRVILKKTADHIEITFPPAGLNDGTLIQVLFAIAWTAALLLMVIQALAMGQSAEFWVLMLFMLPFAAIGFKLLRDSARSLLQVTKLYITPDAAFTRTQLLGQRSRARDSIPRDQMNKLMLDFIQDTGSRIVFQTNTGDRQLATSYNLTRSELDWLTYELGRELGLPIERRNFPDF